MWEFLQAYGIWIVLGLFFVLMMRGGGCGMGHQHSGQKGTHESDREPVGSPARSAGSGTATVAATRSGGACH